VFARGIRTKMAINIGGLMLLAMMLIGFVGISTIQQDLVQREIDRAKGLLDAFDQDLGEDPSETFLFDRSDLSRRWHAVSCGGQWLCLMIVDRQKRLLCEIGEDRRLGEALAQLTRQTITTGQAVQRMEGTTWGVFWRQPSHLLFAAPILRDNHLLGGAGIALPLEEIYGLLRRTQAMLSIYIAINTVLMTFAAVLRFSKITIRPLQRLARRAEEYRETDGVLFTVRKQDNELANLSMALNRMLTRIDEDKRALKETVRSLEEANFDLKKAQKDVIQAEKLASVGRLATGIAHEIGNPIGIVLGYLELLKKEDAGVGERDDYIRRAEQEIGRINTIIRQLLDFSRPSPGELERVSMHEVIRDTVEMVRIQPLMADIDCQLDLAAAEDRVVAEEDQLRQMVLNLVLNAVDAIFSSAQRGSGRLRIVSRNPMQDGHGLLEVVVSDNGAGIAPEAMDNIFDPFFTTKEPGKGTGLGLSVCFMIVESMGGHIVADSIENEGTAITLSLPFGSLPAAAGAKG